MDWEFSFDELVSRRRHLHEHPELSNEEHETQGYVLKTLHSFGLAQAVAVASTGVKCRIGPETGRAIALRADMDGLPVQEISDKSYKSKNVGKMHACGHDGHVSALLSVAHVLSRVQKELKVAVVLLFQPAEEGFHGAKRMVEENALADVSHCFGIHLWNTLPVHTIGVSEGPVMANSDRFEIIVQGKGGHGSMPHDTIDPIVVGSNLVVLAQQIVSRRINPANRVVISFGCFESSSKTPNIIADSVKLNGTVRSYSPDSRDQVKKEMQAIVSGLEISSGAKITFNFVVGYNAVVNEADATKMVISSASKLAGTKIESAPVVLSGEDFFYYQKVAKCCFIFVGSAIGDGVLRPHHSPGFDIDESALGTSVRLFLQIVKDNCL